MENLRKRAMEARAADAARNRLMEELLQQVDDMQKKMDRNAFTLVLIDGDSMNFLDDLVKKGMAGGSEASSRLRQRVFNALRHDADFRHDEKIVVKVDANLRGLSNLYVQKGLVPSTDEFAKFVLGFNKAHPLCDFIDAGNHKESADKKLQETLDLHFYNVHCKHIIFGGPTDNAYASFLSSYHDVDTSRIRLLKGPPFAFEFHSILHKYKQVEFNDVFRSEKLSPSRIDLSVRSRVPPTTKPPPISDNTFALYAASKKPGAKPQMSENMRAILANHNATNVKRLKLKGLVWNFKGCPDISQEEDKPSQPRTTSASKPSAIVKPQSISTPATTHPTFISADTGLFDVDEWKKAMEALGAKVNLRQDREQFFHSQPQKPPTPPTSRSTPTTTKAASQTVDPTLPHHTPPNVQSSAPKKPFAPVTLEQLREHDLQSRSRKPPVPPTHTFTSTTTDIAPSPINSNSRYMPSHMHISTKRKEFDPAIFKRREDIPPHLRRWPAHMIPTPYSGQPSA